MVSAMVGWMVRLVIVGGVVAMSACSPGSAASGTSSDGDTECEGSEGEACTFDDDDSDTWCDNDGGSCCFDPICCGDPCCSDSTAGCDEDDDNDVDDSEDDGPPPPGECDLIDCSPGLCVLDDEGQGTCDCPDDYASVGDACVACVAVSGSHDIDIPIVDFTIRGFIEDGEPGLGASSRWWLIGPGGDEVELGDALAGERTVQVVPGRYSIHYGWLAGDDLPRNSAAVIGLVDIDAAAGAVDLGVGLRTSQVQGDFYFDGVLAPDSAAENGEIVLRSGEDEVSLGETRLGHFAVRVLEGSYDVEYRAIAGGQIAPVNTAATFLNLAVSGWSFGAGIDVPTLPVSGQFTIEGVPTPASKSDSGRISLVAPGGRDIVVLGDTHDGEYAARVVPGTYDLIYEATTVGAVVPSNQRAEIGQVAIGAPAVFDVDIPAVEVSGALTLSGVPGDAATTGDAQLWLVSNDGDSSLLGSLSDGSFTARVVPGAYSIVYSNTVPGGVELPINPWAILSEVDVGAFPSIDIDVPAVVVSGVMTVDGAVPPVMDDGGRILLDDAGAGDPFALASTGDASFTATVVPGDYDVRYAADPPTVVAPSNADVRIGAVTIIDDLVVDVDVPVTDVMGSIGIGGVAPPASHDGELHHTDATGVGALGLVSSVGEGAYAGRLVPARYVVRYAAIAEDASPANRDAPIACIDLTE